MRPRVWPVRINWSRNNWWVNNSHEPITAFILLRPSFRARLSSHHSHSLRIKLPRPLIRHNVGGRRITTIAELWSKLRPCDKRWSRQFPRFQNEKDLILERDFLLAYTRMEVVYRMLSLFSQYKHMVCGERACLKELHSCKSPVQHLKYWCHWEKELACRDYYWA